MPCFGRAFSFGRSRAVHSHAACASHPIQMSNSGDRHDRAFSLRRSRPSFAATCLPDSRGRREDRAPADAHGPRATKKHAAEPQAQPRVPGLPCAMVLTAYSELSPGTGLFCPRHSQSARCALRDLSASVGAPGPHGLAVRARTDRLPPHARPPHPASTFVTTRTSLYTRRDARMMLLIWGWRKTKYFFAQDWTGRIVLKGLGKFRFWCE
jgi:hypothetical protein